MPLMRCSSKPQASACSSSARLVHHLHRPHSRDVQNLYGKIAPSSGPALLSDVAAFNRQFSESSATSVQQLIAQNHLDHGHVLAIGHLGPLAWHEPGGRSPSSFEYGLASVLVERTGLSVFNKFRERDMAAGGQGMPITALADWVQFREATEARLLIHLGGVTSVVYIPGGASLKTYSRLKRALARGCWMPSFGLARAAKNIVM